ncbi:MAG: hypothetical protein NVS9B15_18080 [Acidobacteriaceae bacterium]
MRPVQLLAVWALMLATAHAGELAGSARLTGEAAPKDQSGTVVYLVPLNSQREVASQSVNTQDPFRLVQKNKAFSPHLLVVPVGAEVEFPNQDPVFHNVFSVYENTRFDLGLYEAGSMKKVRFTRPGASFIFCNIHPEMSAVIFAIDTPFYAVTDQGGRFRISHIPDGSYELRAWSERARQEALQLRKPIEVRGNTTASMMIEAAPSIARGHKNKFGKDYDVSVPTKYP